MPTSTLTPDTFYLPRKARQRLPGEGKGREGELSDPKRLDHWRDVPAYVLLGDPGAGKTTAFRHEADDTGAQFCTARQISWADLSSAAAETTLFIDALDEAQVQKGDNKSQALSEVCQRLSALGKPKFRLACREIDWRGGPAEQDLKLVSPDGAVVELHLEPFSTEDVGQLLEHWPNVDAEVFFSAAEQFGLDGAWGNPLVVELLCRALQSGEGRQAPRGKADVFRLATQELAQEHNEAHNEASARSSGTAGHVLDDAGKLFAVLLLSGKSALRLGSNLAAEDEAALGEISREFGVQDNSPALSSKLFTAHGQRLTPWHRAVAEYLGAQAISQQVNAGLPLTRVLALMLAPDGGVVEGLRGLHAWLAYFVQDRRDSFIERDPVGLVVNGDVRAFTRGDKRQLFDQLASEPALASHFRWSKHALAPLATLDMADDLLGVIHSRELTKAQAGALEVALIALRQGGKLQGLGQAIASVVENAEHAPHLRRLAAMTWLEKYFEPGKALEWLNAIKSSELADSDDQLAGHLLLKLYPEHITPQQVFDYWWPVKQKSFIGQYHHFWRHDLAENTPAGLTGVLAESLAGKNLASPSSIENLLLWNMQVNVIHRALEAGGELAEPPQVVRWLQMGRNGFDHNPLRTTGQRVGKWLTEHPKVLKAAFREMLFSQAEKSASATGFVWQAEEFMFSANKPDDWYPWLLGLAAETLSEPLACDLFEHVARLAVSPSGANVISIEEVEHWVNANSSKWPKALEWQKDAWSLPIDGWQAKQQASSVGYEIEQKEAQSARELNFAKRLGGKSAQDVDLGTLYTIALAWKDRYSDIRGESGEERVRNLVVNPALEPLAIAALRAALQRPDIPNVDAIFATGLAGKEHRIRPPCLVAAELEFNERQSIPAEWTEGLLKQLIAFWLTDGTGEEPAWFAALAHTRPDLVALVMAPYAVSKIRSEQPQGVTGLWALAREVNRKELARLVLPGVLGQFPVRANAHQLHVLTHDLLLAAGRSMSKTDLLDVIQGRLLHSSMDVGQRIAWLGLGALLSEPKLSQHLIKFIGKSQSRALQLLYFLNGQTSRGEDFRLPMEAAMLMIEQLGAHVRPSFENAPGMVRPVDEGRMVLVGLVNTLTGNPDPSAKKALARLRANPALSHWHEALERAQAAQVKAQREGQFKPATPTQVANTLTKLKPANAADLLALAVEVFKECQAELDGSDTTPTRNYWQWHNNEPTSPKIENLCRYLLVDFLRPRLKALDVLVDLEIHANDDKRMDIRLAFAQDGKRIVVPVEAKKDSHKDLWTAWRTQLQAKYTTIPGCEGYGIYLVLWFDHKPTKLEGKKPQNGEELKQWLEEKIPAADRHLIQVVVLDMRLPVTPSNEKSR